MNIRDLSCLVLPFGKYCGQRFGEIPLSYLDNVYRSLDDTWLKRRLRDFLDHRTTSIYFAEANSSGKSPSSCLWQLDSLEGFEREYVVLFPDGRFKTLVPRGLSDVVLRNIKSIHLSATDDDSKLSVDQENGSEYEVVSVAVWLEPEKNTYWIKVGQDLGNDF